MWFISCHKLLIPSGATDTHICMYTDITDDSNLRNQAYAGLWLYKVVLWVATTESGTGIL